MGASKSSSSPIAPTAALTAVRRFLATPPPLSDLVFVPPTPTLLLSGPPGVGKTHAVRIAADEASIPLHVLLPGPASASRLRNTFAVARRTTTARVLVFIDELDAICPPSSSNKLPASVATLAALLDPPPLSLQPPAPILFIIAATNRPAHVHPNLLRPPRFVNHVRLPIPDITQRAAMLAALLPPAYRPLASALAVAHPAAVVADLVALLATDPTNTVAQVSYSKHLPPSSLVRTSKQGTVVSVSSSEHWHNIIGADAAKRALVRAVEWPMRHKPTLSRLGIRPTRGILLYGPPGAAKTALVRTTATIAQRPLFALSSADVYSPFLGEAERCLRDVFSAARAAAPAMLFLDELDGLVGRRGVSSDGRSGGGGEVSSRVLSTLLTEMDGIVALGDVLVIAATNRLDCVDEALLRPGRFDEVIQVELPDLAERVAILKLYSRPLPLAATICFNELGNRTEGWTGARLKALCTEAGLAALRESSLSPDNEDVQTDVIVEMRHFDTDVFAT